MSALKGLLFVVLAATLAGCGLSPAIVGSGNIITDNRAVSLFHAISSNAVSNIALVQDGTQTSVEVSGYENLVPLIETNVDNGTLVIEMKTSENLRNNNTKITIHVPQLDQIVLSGVGNLNTDGEFNFADLNMHFSGVGSLKLTGKADNFTLDSSGVGSVSAKDLVCGTADMQLSGVGDITCNAQKTLKVNFSGVGSVTYFGSPQTDIHASGVGTVKHGQ